MCGRNNNVNEIFPFKNDKYKKYFAEFDKKKRYLLYPRCPVGDFLSVA